jgi:hypothetical protein
MSHGLYWRPVPKDQPPPESASSLKHLLIPKLWGDSTPPLGDETEAGRDLIPYLEGIRDSTGDSDMKEDAAGLIAAIREHGAVEMWVGA